MRETSGAGPEDRLLTGISGLDAVLRGGLTPSRLYLVEGTPGSGKTTLALRFLLEGRSAGDHGLYITLSETENELRAVAQSHGFTLDGIGTATFGAIILYHILNRAEATDERDAKAPSGTADA